MGSLAWSATTALQVAAFAPALLAQGGGQAVFVACTAAFASGGFGDSRRLLALAFAGVVLKLAGQAGASAIQAAWVARVGQQLREALLGGLRNGKSLHTPGLPDHGRLAAEVPGELAARVDDVERGVGEGLLPALRAVVELVPLLGLVLWTVPRFALLSLLVLVPFGFWLSRSRRGVAQAVGAGLQARGHLLTAFDEAIRHDDLWRVHGASGRIRAQIRSAGQEGAASAVKLAARTELASGQNEALGVVFVWLCVALAPDVAAAPALLLRFFAAFFLTYKPLRQLVVARTALARGRLALRSLALEAGPVPADPRPRAWAPATLRVQGLHLAHGSQARLDLEAAPGALVLVTGASGAGKSTFLRTLLGLTPALEGQISYGDDSLDVAGVGPAARPFAWLPQACPIVGASVDAALLLEGPPCAVAFELLADVEGDAHTLSGGEAQRVAFVRALSSPSPVVLLDEPTAQLDDDLAQRMLGVIQSERERGRTFVVVTHEPDRFARLPGARELSISGYVADSCLPREAAE